MTSPRSQLLFVDDDSNVIASIRRVLRSKADIWQLHWAHSGQEALDIAKDNPLDAIVTDMRMPGMDGATVLARVHELHPSAVRMVLSGQSDREYSIAAAKYAHRFLSKPCMAEDLSEHVRSTLEARARLLNIGAADLVSQVDVCVDGDVLIALTESLGQAQFSPDAVCSLIRDHSGVVLKLLQLVSSSFFASRRPTMVARDAVATLGPEVLRNLLRSGLFHAVAEERRQALRDCHAVARRTADLARHVADECQLPPRDRDKLGSAAQFISVTRTLCVRACAASRGNISAWQAAATQAAESAALLQLWGVPQPLTQAVSEFTRSVIDDEPSIEGSVLALAVVLAHSTCEADVALADYPQAALVNVLHFKPIEAWAQSAGGWSSQEIAR